MENIHRPSPLKLAFVFGTRPEAIKLSVPILRAKHDSRFQPIVISTGQHREMMRPILEFFGIQPQFDLDLMKPGQSLTEFVANAMLKLREAWQIDRPDIVCIQGDTATCAAGALAAFFEKIPLAHIEAGLRTNDLSSPFPEEYNRRLVSLSAKWNFAPTENAKQALLREHVSESSVIVTGNTGIDALLAVRDRLKSDASTKIRLEETFPDVAKAKARGKKIVLVTTHRRESFGEPLRETLSALRELANRRDVQAVFPVHRNPAVLEAVREILGERPEGVTLLEPLDYVPFVWMMDQSSLILTDSGGIQEEAPSLGKPVLILREKTERPEAIEAGTAKLVGTAKEKILKEAFELLDSDSARDQMTSSKNPFGDGKATKRILDILAATTP